MVTTNTLICVDETGRTARHIEGDIRLDYMCDNHYWVIVKNIKHMDDSFPTPGTHRVVNGVEDIGELWIPDLSVANIRWFSRRAIR